MLNDTFSVIFKHRVNPFNWIGFFNTFSNPLFGPQFHFKQRKLSEKCTWIFLFDYNSIKFYVSTGFTMFENHRKVSCYIASEASYVYILSGQKLIKNAKNGPI